MTPLAKIMAAALISLSSGSLLAAGDARHHPGIFIGTTTVNGDTDTTLGIEYEYKFNPYFGVGGVWERSKEAHDGDGVNVWVGSFFYHPTEHWRLGLGFGEERIGGYKTKHHSLMRVSAAYEFFGDGYILAPELAVDFIGDEEATVAGVSVLFPF